MFVSPWQTPIRVGTNTEVVLNTLSSVYISVCLWTDSGNVIASERCGHKNLQMCRSDQKEGPVLKIGVVRIRLPEVQGKKNIKFRFVLFISCVSVVVYT